jgi:hypothetical protein
MSGVLSAFRDWEHPTVVREAFEGFERTVDHFAAGFALYLEAHARLAVRNGLDPEVGRREAARRIRQKLIDGGVIGGVLGGVN